MGVRSFPHTFKTSVFMSWKYDVNDVILFFLLVFNIFTVEVNM